MAYTVQTEAWPIAGDGFAISREVKRDAIVVHVTLAQNGHGGEGECVPLKRYHHTPEKIEKEIRSWLSQGHPLTRDILNAGMKPGPARFALDTALWQMESAMQGKPLWQLAGLTEKPDAIPTAFTLSGAAPVIMAEAAKSQQEFRWLKIKLMGDGMDRARVEEIHRAAPGSELIVDANEGLTPEMLRELLPVFLKCRVVLIEQPLPEGKDEALRSLDFPIPLAADESCHTMEDLEGLRGKYQAVNIKLDKTGGLSHALDMAKRAREMGFSVMAGCMASTSLSIYPACMLAPFCDFTDLDGALLLQKDRQDAKIAYRDGRIYLLG